MSRRRQPQPAPWSARVLAAAIDATGVLAISAAVVVTVYCVMKHLRRSGNGSVSSPGWVAALQRPSVKLALGGVDLGVRLALHGRPTPGQRIAGIHLVELRTGEAPGARATVVAWGVKQAISIVSRQLSKRIPSGDPDVRADAARRLKALMHTPDADPEALEAVQRENARLSQRGCLPVLGFGLAEGVILRAVAARSPRHQTLDQRLAATMLVRD